MCVAMAGRVVSVDVDGRNAVVDVDGGARRVALTLLVLDGRATAPGDWLLVHTGLAVEVIDAETATELMELHRGVHGTADDTGRNDHAGA